MAMMFYRIEADILLQNTDEKPPCPFFSERSLQIKRARRIFVVLRLFADEYSVKAG
jgi:hypothetical protein